METTRVQLSHIYALTQTWVTAAVRHSYALSRCHREPTAAELGAHRGLMMCRRLELTNVIMLMSYIEPTATLRQGVSRKVGGDDASALQNLLELANTKLAAPDELMSLFALARPFTAGNDRCGRALWLWRVLQGNERELAAHLSAGTLFHSPPQHAIGRGTVVSH